MARKESKRDIAVVGEKLGLSVGLRHGVWTY